MARTYSLFWNFNMVSSSIRCLAPNKVVEQELPLVFPPFPSSLNENMKLPFLFLYLVYIYVYMHVHMDIYIHKVSSRSHSRCSSLIFCKRGNHPSSPALVYLHHPITSVAVASPILSVHISSEMLCLSVATCWPPAFVSSLLLSLLRV